MRTIYSVAAFLCLLTGYGLPNDRAAQLENEMNARAVQTALPHHEHITQSRMDLINSTRFGFPLYAADHAETINAAGEGITLEPDEAVEMISVDLDSDRALGRRLAYSGLVTVSRLT